MKYQLFALFALAIIPLINWNRRQEAGFYLITLASAVLVLQSVWTGFSIPWDPVTQAAAGLSLYLLSSVVWSTHYRQSIFDAVNLSACVFLFLVLRMVPAEISLSAVAITASGISSGLILDKLKLVPANKLIGGGNHKTFFGNTNHTGFYAAVGVMASAWLIFNQYFQVLFMFCAALCIVGVVVSRCRSAIATLITSVMVYGILIGHWLTVTLFSVAATLLIHQIMMKMGSMQAWRKSLKHRASFMSLAGYLAGQRPIFGWGLRTYRVHAPDVSRILKRKKWWNDLRSLNDNKPAPVITHRVHCDPLEWVVETGLVGLTILATVAASLTWEDPVLSAAMIGIILGSCLFFPFREAHILPGILAIAAVMAPAGSGIAGPWIQIAVTASILGMLVRFGKRFNGIIYLWRLKRSRYFDKKNVKKHTMLLNKMIDSDPYNNSYLAFGYWFYHSDLGKTDIAFKMASRAIENFDGEKVKHQMYDSYGKYALALGGPNIAENAFRHTLDIEPDYKPTLDAMVIVNKLQAKILNLQKKQEKDNAKRNRHRELSPNAARS